jgi:hypothetical protein
MAAAIALVGVLVVVVAAGLSSPPATCLFSARVSKVSRVDANSHTFTVEIRNHTRFPVLLRCRSYNGDLVATTERDLDLGPYEKTSVELRMKTRWMNFLGMPKLANEPRWRAMIRWLAGRRGPPSMQSSLPMTESMIFDSTKQAGWLDSMKEH